MDIKSQVLDKCRPPTATAQLDVKIRKAVTCRYSGRPLDLILCTVAYNNDKKTAVKFHYFNDAVRRMYIKIKIRQWNYRPSTYDNAQFLKTCYNHNWFLPVF